MVLGEFCPSAATVYYRSNEWSDFLTSDSKQLYTITLDLAGDWNWMVERVIRDTGTTGAVQYKANDDNGNTWWGRNSAPGYNGSQFTDVNEPDGNVFKFRDYNDSYVFQHGDTNTVTNRYSAFKRYVLNLSGNINSWSLITDTFTKIEQTGNGDTWQLQKYVSDYTNDTTFKVVIGNRWEFYSLGEILQAATQQTIPAVSAHDKLGSGGTGNNIWLKFPTSDTYIWKVYFPFGDSAAWYRVERKLDSFVLNIATEGIADTTVYDSGLFTLKVRAMDRLGETYTQYNGSCTFTVSNGSFSDTIFSTFVNGVAQESVYIQDAAGYTRITAWSYKESGAISVIVRPRVKINEVLFNSSFNPDIDDWIELHNPTDSKLSLVNWVLRDVGNNFTYTFPSSAEIDSRGFVVFHPKIAQATSRLDFGGRKHFYLGSTQDWFSDTQGALELYRSATLDSSTLVDFVTWTNPGGAAGIGNPAWDDTAVLAGIWKNDDAIAGLLSNTDSSIQLAIDGADSDRIGNYSDSAPGEGLTNNAIQPVKIDTSVKFTTSDFSTADTTIDPGDSVYIVVTTGHNQNSSIQQAVQVYLGRGVSGDTILVTCYESGVNSMEYRGVAVLNDYTSTSAIDAARGAPGETFNVTGLFDNTKSATAPIYPNHIPAVGLADMQFLDSAIIVPNVKFRIRTVFSDNNGGTDITRMYARISTATETIQYYARAPANDSQAVAVQGSDSVYTVTVDTRAYGSTLACTWTFSVKWNFVEAANYTFSARVTDDKDTSAWTDTSTALRFENDLKFSGAIVAKGETNGTLSNNDWVQSNERCTFSGLTVVFDGTTISPSSADFDIRLTHEYNGETLTQTTGDTLVDTVITLAQVAVTPDTVRFTIVNITSPGSDLSNDSFLLRTDSQTPIIKIIDDTYVFKADTYSRAPAIDIDFSRGDSLSLLDSAQVQVGGVWYNIFTADVDTFFNPWFLSELAYSKLDSVAATTINVRVYDQSDRSATASFQVVYEPITIDGKVTDWKGDEKMQVDSLENLWFQLAWDDTNVYFAYDPKILTGAGDGDFFVYFDCLSNTGTVTSFNWGSYGPHNLPTETGAQWDNMLGIENNTYFELRQETGAGWTIVEDNSSFSGQGFVGNATDKASEFRIPWRRLTNGKGKPDTFNVVAFQQYDDTATIWTSYPTANPGNGAVAPANVTSDYSYLNTTDTVSPNSVVQATINVDGGLADWPDTTVIPAWRGGSVSASFRVYWDATFLFFTFSRGNAFPNSGTDYDVIQVYIDTSAGAVNFGADSTVSWTGAHTLPVKAGWAFLYAVNNAGGADYTNLRKWNGASWVADQSWGGAVAKNNGGGIAEFSVPLKDIGDTDDAKISKMRLTLYVINGATGYLWSSAPNANPEGAAPVTLTSYIQYDSMATALNNPGAYYFTRFTKALPAGDTISAPFTPYLDGAKDPGWGDTPDANSGGAAKPDSSSTGDDAKKFPQGLTKNVYFTNNVSDLYIGWEAMGDHYNLEVDNSQQTANYGFILMTDSYPSGGSRDPWKTTSWTTRVYQHSADFWINGYIGYGVNDFGGMTLYKYDTGLGAWDTGTALATGTDFKVSVSNGWGELKIPLSTLKLKAGDTIGVIHYSRHAGNKVGITDVTPYQSAAVSDWGDANASIDATKSKVYVIQPTSNINVFHKPNTEPVGGKGLMRTPLNPNAKDAVTVTVEAAPVGIFKNLQVIFTKNNWTTVDTLTLTSAYTSGSNEYFQASIPANFSKNDTGQYYIRVNETIKNYVYGNDTNSYVTSSASVAQTNAYTFRVINAAPTPPDSVFLTPKTPLDASILKTAASGATDKDADTLTYVFVWYKNAGSTGLTRTDSTYPYSDTVGADSTSAGEVWYCDVSAGDGEDTSAATRSNAVNLNELNVWSGTAPIAVNTAVVSDSEWIWLDKTADQRTVAVSNRNFDITEMRLEMDTTYLHFLVYIDELSNANYPNLAVSFDTDGTAGSGNTGLGDEGQTTFGDSYAAPAARWESQMIIHTFVIDSPILEVVKGSTWSETTVSVFIDTTAYLIKGRIPRSTLGLTGSGQVRCAAAMFKNRIGKAVDINSTVEYPVSDALDAVSVPGIYGRAAVTNDKTHGLNAYDEEIGDGDVDFWFQLRYDAGGIVPNNKPAKVTGPSPADGGTTSSLAPTFSWSMTSDTDSNDTVASYLIEIGTTANLDSNVEYRVNLAAESTSFKPPSNLTSDSYYWRVRARDRTGTLSDTIQWSFSVTTPTLTAATPRDINNVNNMGEFQDLETAYDTIYWQWAPATHSFTWKIQNYFIEISEYPAFDSVILSDTLIGTSAQGCTTFYQIPASYQLTRGKTYYARVKAGDTGSPQNWSAFSAASDGVYYSMKSIDGDTRDWVTSATLGVATNTESFVTGNFLEAAWRDTRADQRTDQASVQAYLDLDQFRVSSDSYNLYLYVKFFTWSATAPYIQIALDVDQTSTSRVFTGRNAFAEDVYVSSQVAREYIIRWRAGTDTVTVVDANFVTKGVGRSRENATDSSIEMCIPLKYVGGISQYTADTVNVTVAISWNNGGSIGQWAANNAHVAEAVTDKTSTWGEVSDQVVDFWLAVGFDSMARIAGVAKETAALTAPPTNPNPGTSFYGAMRDYIIYNVFVDRFWNGTAGNAPSDPDMIGGDFQGLIDQVQYFNDLGINAFQLSASLDYGGGTWGYNQHDLYKVQGSYVTQNWNAYKGFDDYVRLAKEMNHHNIDVGLDWVPGQIYGNATSGGTAQKNQKMFFGDRFGGRRVLQYVAEARQFFVDHTRFLYAVGTDLFRVDNPKFYPDPTEQGHAFTAYWNEQVKTFAPTLYSYGEVPDAASAIGGFTRDGERLTGCLDMRTGDDALKSWANDGASTSGSSFRSTIDGNYAQYNGSALPVMVNYYENHDNDRAYHKLSDVMTWAGSVGDVQTLMMWEAGGIGVPCVFYGDERVMMGKKSTTYPDWQFTESTSKFGNTRAFPWTYDGATGDIQGAVSKAFKGRQVFPALRYDQNDIQWKKSDGEKPIAVLRGAGTSEEVLVLINPNDAAYNFTGIGVGAANATYKDWMTNGTVTSNAGFTLGDFSVGSNYAAFLKVNSFGLASCSVTVKVNGALRPKAIVSIEDKSAYTKETDNNGWTKIDDILTGSGGSTNRTVKIWYPGYNVYKVSWTFTDGQTANGVIDLATSPYAGADAVAPAAPIGLMATQRDRAVVLDWADNDINKDSDIESYYIYRSTTPNDNNAAMILEVMRSTFYDKNFDDGLNNGTTYYYKIKARDLNGNLSGFSKEIAVTPNLTTVTFQVDMTNSGLNNITQLYIKGNSVNLTRSDFNSGFKNSEIDPLVKMENKGRNIWEKTIQMDPGINVNYLFICNYNNGATWFDEYNFWNTYGYENARGVTVQNSGTQPIVRVWMDGDDEPPQKPQGLTAVGQNEVVKLGWSLNLEADVDHYEMWKSTNDVSYTYIGNIGKNVINYTDIGLTNGTKYYYKMKAVDLIGGASGFSDTVTATATATADDTAPTRPSGLAAKNGGANTVVLSWTYNTEGDLAGYNVYRGTSPGFAASASNRLNAAAIVPTLTPSWTDGTAQTATQYYYAVKATDDFQNESDSSNVLAVKLARLTFEVDVGTMNTGGAMKFTANDNFATWSGRNMTDSGSFAWTFTTDMIVGAALEYRYASADTKEIDFNTTSRNRELTVPDAAQRTYADDWQEYPDAVANLSGQPDSAAAWLFWDANKADQDLYGYNVYRQESSGGFTKLNTSNITAAQYKVTGLTNGTAYSFAVRASDTGVLSLESPNSSIIKITPGGYVFVEFRN